MILSFTTDLFRTIILVAICLHIPYDLVTEELRYFCGLKYEPLNVTFRDFSVAETVMTSLAHLKDHF